MPSEACGCCSYSVTMEARLLEHKNDVSTELGQPHFTARPLVYTVNDRLGRRGNWATIRLEPMWLLHD